MTAENDDQSLVSGRIDQENPTRAGDESLVSSRTSYRGYLRGGYVAVALLLIGLGGWSAVANITGAVIALGSVGVEGKPKTVQHLEGGIVGAIYVKAGDYVMAGQDLVRLDDTLLKANLAIIENRLFEAVAREARLEAERDGAENLAAPKEFTALPLDNPLLTVLEGQRKFFEARRATREGELAQLKERVVQLNDEIDGLLALKASNARQRELIAQELDGLRILFDKGHVSNTRLLALEREQARLEGEIGEQTAAVARTRNAIAETRLEMLQVTRDFREQVLGDLSETAALAKELREQRISALDQLKRIDITAPVSGIIHDLNIHTIGGVVMPAAPIMQIVPIEERLVIEARILPTDIDQVRASQRAKIRFSAFSQRTTPEVNATVTRVAPDRLVDEMTGEVYYAVTLKVADVELATLSEFDLHPGMPAEVYIATGERVALSYLLKPLSDQMNRAFREE